MSTRIKKLGDGKKPLLEVRENKIINPFDVTTEDRHRFHRMFPRIRGEAHSAEFVNHWFYMQEFGETPELDGTEQDLLDAYLKLQRPEKGGGRFHAPVLYHAMRVGLDVDLKVVDEIKVQDTLDSFRNGEHGMQVAEMLYYQDKLEFAPDRRPEDDELIAQGPKQNMEHLKNPTWARQYIGLDVAMAHCYARELGVSTVIEDAQTALLEESIKSFRTGPRDLAKFLYTIEKLNLTSKTGDKGELPPIRKFKGGFE